MVEADAAGFQRGRNLKKLGQKSADTSELFFSDCRVPVDNLLGEREGQGFIQLMQQLPQERLNIAQAAIVQTERAIEHDPGFREAANGLRADGCWISRIPGSSWPNAKRKR